MAQGTVKFYNVARGFGFIEKEGGGNDIFVHISCCCDGIEELREGQKVSFSERKSRRKPDTFEAIDVQVI
jgi:cold shock protein